MIILMPTGLLFVVTLYISFVFCDNHLILPILDAIMSCKVN